MKGGLIWLKIYIDGDFICHTTQEDGYREIETDYFDNKCPEWIEGYRFVPAGEVWIRDDGVKFYGEMISPWKNVNNLYSAQNIYITDKFVSAQEDIAELDSALLDVEYNNLIGDISDE